MATQSKTQKNSGSSRTTGKAASSGRSGTSGSRSASSAKTGGSSSRSASSSNSSNGAGTRGRSAAQNKEQQRGALLEKFFHDALKDIYYAEKLLTKALPRMRKAATTPQLQAAFDSHLNQTQEQIKRLEQVFQLLGKRAQTKKCPGMDGIVAEGEEVIEETKSDTMTRDVALIMAAQKVEHYEIASYGTLVKLAQTMGQHEAATLLEKTLDEEKETDMVLTHIAQNNINERAEMEGAGGRNSSGQPGSQGPSKSGSGTMAGMSSGKSSGGGRSGGR